VAKAGRPKAIRPHEVRMAILKDPLKTRTKRFYWAMLQMEKKMAKDITSVNMKDYQAIVIAYTDSMKELKKLGHEYKGKPYAPARMDKQGLDQDQSEDNQATSSDNGSSGVGAGIPPVNPLT